MRPDAKYHDEPCSMPRFKDRRIVPCARRPQGGCAGDATSSLVKYLPCAHHQPGEIALQKCTNCELIFEIEWICPYAQHEKKMKSSWLQIGKKCDFHACARRVRARRACPHNFILTTAFITHWYFVLQKNSYEISFKKNLHWKILKICSFSWFFENDWNTNRWLEKSEHKIIKIHEIRFFIMSYLTVLTSYHTM